MLVINFYENLLKTISARERNLVLSSDQISFDLVFDNRISVLLILFSWAISIFLISSGYITWKINTFVYIFLIVNSIQHDNYYLAVQLIGSLAHISLFIFSYHRPREFVYLHFIHYINASSSIWSLDDGFYWNEN